MAEVTSHWQTGPLQVVINGSGAYAIWPAERALPAGWTPAGFSGPRADCLAYIAREWTGLAPAGLREHPSAPEYSVPAGDLPLVDRLIHGAHAVRASGLSGYVQLTLTGIPGEPEIGLLPPETPVFLPGEQEKNKNDFSCSSPVLLISCVETAVFEGTCVLDGTPLTAVVTVDPRSLSGTATFTRLVSQNV